MKVLTIFAETCQSQEAIHEHLLVLDVSMETNMPYLLKEVSSRCATVFVMLLKRFFEQFILIIGLIKNRK